MSRKILPFTIIIIIAWICLLIYTGQAIFIVFAAKSFTKEVLQIGKTQLLEPIQPAALFEEYLINFNKSYGKEELAMRFKLFKESLKEISRLNQEKTSATYGLTKFSDMSKEEILPPPSRLQFSECRILDQFCLEQSVRHILSYDLCSDFQYYDLQDKLDWREEGVVGPVLDQKQCLGCWAFGIVGVMESMAAIHNIEHDVRLSIQELIDCSTGYTQGCNKGNVAKALTWLCDHNVDVVTENEYPLKLVNQNCSLHQHEGRRIKHFCQLCNANSEDIMRLLHHGPVLAVVNADSWLYYTGGVIQQNCYRSHDGTTVDHVVQIIGYDQTADVPHFIIRNSWGEDFGDKGYVMLALEGNVCGVNDEISFFDVY